MKKLLILALPLLLFNCSSTKTEASIDYDYTDVSSLTICWDDIFKVHLDRYFVYIYSSTCGHCNEIKQDVISYALSNFNTLYFVSFTKSIPIVDDRFYPIGKCNVEDLGIVGTPSMFLIVNHIVEENYVGKKEIIRTLTNE